ncbi:TonB-dependent receptor plug domain-containing protein [Lacinutrix venerupis]|uniref:TonB-dependent receptor n=1 Tax=Lacinutrix venerupis TaxID=1486034 RepID=A0AAC9LME8_9FLAO|nr:TonB-dependent receptor plug domain-containing protein [Lacinutrix venerupis]APX99517.1 TonB-dependent receptor [Lacinutrix venerupis]
MSKKITFALLIILFFFSSISVKSQTFKTERLPLTTILKALEKRFDIRFTYADKTIEGVEINEPSKILSYNDAITYLRTNTNLNFKIINSRFVAIAPSRKVTRPIEALQEVQLKTYLTTGILKTKTGEVVLNTEEFGILPGLIEPDVLQTVQALPSVLSIDESVSNLNIRGGTHDQNLILWDGIKMYQSGHFFGLISAFNPNLVSNVVISKNGTSALYGDGVSSTIDMRLDTDLNQKNTSGLGLNLIQLDGFTKLKLQDNMELQVSARRSNTDIVNTPTYTQYFNKIFQDLDADNSSISSKKSTSNETFYFYDISAKLLHDLSYKDKLRISFTTIYNSLDYIESSFNNNTTTALNNGITQNNLAAGLNYNRQWSKFVSSELQINVSDYKLKATNFNTQNNQSLQQNNEVLDKGITFQLKLDFNDRLRWINGYQFSQVGITNLEIQNNPEFRNNTEHVVNTHSTFSEFTFSSYNNKTHLKIGTRSNYFKPFNVLLLEPRISVNHKFFKHFKVELLGEIKSQVTSQVIERQNDFLGIEKRRWILANNTTLPIIESNQASLGLHYNKNKLLVSAEAFIKHVDGITSRSQGFQNQYQNINAIGNYETKGIDFLVNKQFKTFSTWLSYSISDNNYSFPTLNNAQSFANNTDISHALTFAGTYTLNSLKLALGFNWSSGKPTTTPNNELPVFDNAINYDTANNTNLDDYFRTDFSGTYNFNLAKKTKAELGFSIWNILNRKNTINRYYILNNDNSISKIDNKSLGFTPNLSFRVFF